MATENKLAQAAIDSSLIVGSATAIGWTVKELTGKSFMNDPSTSVTNFLKWMGLVAGGKLAIDYARKEGWIPK